MNPIPSLGQGEIVRDTNGQLRDNLSRLWCACGEAAVLYCKDNLPQYQFVCINHSPKEEQANDR